MARKAKVRGTYKEEVRKDQLLRQYDYRCGICGEELHGDVTIDHIVPASRGGEHSYENTQPAHRVCNKAKADLMPHEVDGVLSVIGRKRRKGRFKNNAMGSQRRRCGAAGQVTVARAAYR